MKALPCWISGFFVFKIMTCVFTDDKNNELHLDFNSNFESSTDDYGVSISLKLQYSEKYIELYFSNDDVFNISNLLSDWIANKEWTKNILRHG